ncbi:MAG: hypothetical protein H6712_18705 [Myxococcales bacterium]|nr:hypothetical protein [Myxococcales bacterium]
MAVALGPWLAGVLALAPVAEVEAQVEASPSGEPSSPAADAVELQWDAPAECGDAAVVRRGLAGFLGERTAVEAGAVVRAEARVEHDEAGYRLLLRTETPSGVTTRETTAQDCAVLVEATALIVAIAVDPSAVVGRSERVPPPPVVAEPEPEPEPAVEPTPAPGPSLVDAPAVELTPAPEPSAAPRLRFGMWIAGGVDVGMLPAVAGGLRLAGAVLGRRWRVELRGDYWLPRTALPQAELGARISLWSVGTRGCGVPGVARAGLEFPLCGGIEAGAMRGDPVGDRVQGGVTGREPWLAADLGAGLSWSPWRFLAVFVRAELVVPILRAGFRVGEVEIHRAGPVGGRGLLGLEARFP